MKKSILRLLSTTVMLALLIGVIVSGIGGLFGWKTVTQFSNGLFWAGGILIGLGILTIVGGFGMRSNFVVVYSQSAGDMSVTERAQRWAADMTQGYGSFLFLILTGVYLICLAVLVGTFF